MATRKERQILREAAAKFNILPKDGIAHLVALGLLQDDSPGEVARALFDTEGLSKRKIGEFLAKPKDYNQEVRGRSKNDGGNGS
jgi:Sec7-like guanine-nucleotide exchange factor